jgi:hypothetical protein
VYFNIDASEVKKAGKPNNNIAVPKKKPRYEYILARGFFVLL